MTERTDSPSDVRLLPDWRKHDHHAQRVSGRFDALVNQAAKVRASVLSLKSC